MANSLNSGEGNRKPCHHIWSVVTIVYGLRGYGVKKKIDVAKVTTLGLLISQRLEVQGHAKVENGEYHFSHHQTLGHIMRKEGSGYLALAY